MGGILDAMRRRRGRIALGFALAAAVLAAIIWVEERSRWIHATDARIKATMVGVSAQLRGQVAAVPVDVGDRVRAGQVLLQLDDREAVFRLQELTAGLEALRAETAMTRTLRDQTVAVARSRLAERRAERRQVEADLNAADARRQQAERQADRARSLRQRGVMSEETMDEAETRLVEAVRDQEDARARIAALKARIAQAEANLLEAEIISHRITMLNRRQDEVASQIGSQRIVVERHAIRTPIDGVVDEIFLEIGEQALPGFRAALVHDPASVWVEANIKETRIARVRLGAPVEVRVDAFPGRAPLQGEVVRIRDVATGEFALLPSPNASGVFTKITQRVPIKIRLAEHDLTLRPGTMVTIAIAVGDTP
ncbi:MAG: HlyD family secretion protein [Alphaproteobacteria bacterium]